MSDNKPLKAPSWLLCVAYVIAQYVAVRVLQSDGLTIITNTISFLFASYINAINENFESWLHLQKSTSRSYPFDKRKILVTSRDLLALLFVYVAIFLLVWFLFVSLLRWQKLNISQAVALTIGASLMIGVACSVFGVYGFFKGFNEGIIAFWRLVLASFISYTLFLVLNAVQGASFFSRELFQQLFQLNANSPWLDWWWRIPSLLLLYLVVIFCMSVHVWLFSIVGCFCNWAYNLPSKLGAIPKPANPPEQNTAE